MPLNTIGGAPIGDPAPPVGVFPANHEYYVREFITIAKRMLFYDMWGMMKPIPKNNSNTIVFNKVEELATTEGSPLTEGVTPTEQQFQLTRISQTVDQYGAFAITTDRLTDESINDVTSEFNKRNAEQGARTMNKVIRDNLLGGTNVRYSNGVVDQDSTVTGPLASDYDFMVTALRLARAEAIKGMTTGSQNINTTPIAEGYPHVVPVEAVNLCEALDDGNGNKFVPMEQYGGQTALWPNEFGKYKQIRFIYETEGKQVLNGTSGKTVAQTMLFGKNAYGLSTIGGSDVEIIIKPLGSSGVVDALNQRASIGWKAKKAATIVQPTYLFRYEFALD